MVGAEAAVSPLTTVAAKIAIVVREVCGSSKSSGFMKPAAAAVLVVIVIAVWQSLVVDTRAELPTASSSSTCGVVIEAPITGTNNVYIHRLAY